MDAATFKRLILPHYRSMYRVALAIIGNEDDAQDAVQETITRLWSKRNSLGDIDNHEAYCILVTKRQCIDMIRRSNRSYNTLDEAAHIDDQHDTMQSIMSTDKLNLVKSLISMLPKQQRQVLELRAFADCSMDEIEQITGLSSVNTRTLLSRARKRLKELYNKHS